MGLLLFFSADAADLLEWLGGEKLLVCIKLVPEPANKSAKKAYLGANNKWEIAAHKFFLLIFRRLPTKKKIPLCEGV